MDVNLSRRQHEPAVAVDGEVAERVGRSGGRQHRERADGDLDRAFDTSKYGQISEAPYIEATIPPREPVLSLDSPIPASHLPGGSKYRPPGARAETEAPETIEDEE